MNTNSTGPRYDVAVCGAGPVGMTAALLLAARGVEVVIFERNAGPSDEPKAISIDDESLRVYQQADIVERILRIMVPGTGTSYYDADDKFSFHAGAATPYRLGYPFKNPFAQPDLERELAAAIAEHPLIEMRSGTGVVGMEQDANGITVSTSGGRSVRAAYLLGCDGGRSTVRSLLGVTMTGRSYPDVWLVVDTLGDDHTERYGMHHADPERPHVVVPGLDGRCRYEFRLFPGEGEPTDTPSFDLIERLVSRYRAITPEQVERAVNYRFHGLVADAWRVDRCFLLGDAAHMMPPFAGQGLNSGIRDAANLAWKIADVLDGRLHERALDSYEAERRPHATASVRASERLGRIVMTTSPRLAAIRDQRVAAALETTDGRDFFEKMRYRPGYRFRGGLVADGADVGVPVGQPRAFDTSCRSIDLIDAQLGTGWALLGVGRFDAHDWVAAEAAARQVSATIACVSTDHTLPRVDGRRVLVDVDGGLDREFAPYHGRFVLIRPDHFVAAAWFPDETARIHSLVADWTAGTHPLELTKGD